MSQGRSWGGGRGAGRGIETRQPRDALDTPGNSTVTTVVVAVVVTVVVGSGSDGSRASIKGREELLEVNLGIAAPTARPPLPATDPGAGVPEPGPPLPCRLRNNAAGVDKTSGDDC